MQQEKQDNQNKLLEWWKKIKGKKGLDTFLIVLIVVIIVAIYASTFVGEKQPEQSPQPTASAGSAQTSGDELEAKLQRTLRVVEGAGEVEVLITYDSSAEIVPAFNTQTQTEENSGQSAGQGESTSKSVDSQIATVQGQGSGQPVVLREDAPSIRGVLVVASGAADPGVRVRLLNAVCTVLNVPSSNVEVLTMHTSKS